MGLQVSHRLRRFDRDSKPPRDGDAAGVVSSQKNVVDSTRMWDTVNDIALRETVDIVGSVLWGEDGCLI